MIPVLLPIGCVLYCISSSTAICVCSPTVFGICNYVLYLMFISYGRHILGFQPSIVFILCTVSIDVIPAEVLSMCISVKLVVYILSCLSMSCTISLGV